VRTRRLVGEAPSDVPAVGLCTYEVSRDAAKPVARSTLACQQKLCGGHARMGPSRQVVVVVVVEADDEGRLWTTTVEERATTTRHHHPGSLA
jgi:hypothetical protein